MLISQRPTLSEDIINDNRSQFVIEPLEPGFGYTLGNSLRRTLLSSIPGAALLAPAGASAQASWSVPPGVVCGGPEVVPAPWRKSDTNAFIAPVAPPLPATRPRPGTGPLRGGGSPQGRLR